jgi:RNA-dependent RNA polymerase
MMSGGDLDGDVYFVCWEETILQHVSPASINPPAKYQKPTIIYDKPADSENIADYIVFYMERDVLGKLANMHLALCD